MFIASNLMTNFTYANPVGTETEITNLDESDESDESDETDEHDTPDMPDSNDGFNDGSDDIHYDGNEDYSFLNETEDTNKIEELGIIKKDILFENTFYYNEQDKKYYTSNLNEKIKNYLISKNIDSDKVVFSKIEYDKNKNLFFVLLKF